MHVQTLTQTGGGTHVGLSELGFQALHDGFRSMQPLEPARTRAFKSPTSTAFACISPLLDTSDGPKRARDGSGVVKVRRGSRDPNITGLINRASPAGGTC